MITKDWLYQHNSQMPLIWRCVGVCLIINALVAASFAACAKPYLVPPLGLSSQCIALDPKVFYCYVILWLGVAFCGVPMVLGSRKKFWPAFAAVFMSALGLMEYTSISCTFIVVTYCYLVALLFDRPGAASCTPRLIQVAVTACYLGSSIHKIHPEWLNGDTMYQIMHNGWNVYSMWMPVLNYLNLNQQVAQFLSIITIVFETALPLALWFQKTRRIAAILGVLFHISLTFFLFGIIPFLPTMLTGYLAFFKNSPAPEQPATRLQPALALAFVAIMVLAPVRFTLLDKPWTQFSFMDWTPWSMAMFLYVEEVKDVAVQYQTPDGTWVTEESSLRMKRASADKDLRALADYVLQKHADAVAVKAKCDLLINKHWQMEKTCMATRDSAGVRFAIAQRTLAK